MLKDTKTMSLSPDVKPAKRARFNAGSFSDAQTAAVRASLGNGGTPFYVFATAYGFRVEAKKPSLPRGHQYFALSVTDGIVTGEKHEAD